MKPLALRVQNAQEPDWPCVRVAGPVREVGVEFGDLTDGEDEVLVSDYQT